MEAQTGKNFKVFFSLLKYCWTVNASLIKVGALPHTPELVIWDRKRPEIDKRRSFLLLLLDAHLFFSLLFHFSISL